MNPALERNATSYGGMLALSGHMLRNYALLENDLPRRPSSRGKAPRPEITTAKYGW